MNYAGVSMAECYSSDDDVQVLEDMEGKIPECEGIPCRL